MTIRERGATGAIVLAVLALMMVAALASFSVQRFASSSDDRGQTVARLQAAARALEQFAAVNKRLPCPADPTINTGVEAQATPSTCSFPEGTLPWQALGLKSEDGYDAWGRKISYRVYQGAAGSLTQANGIDMVQCDTLETATAGNATPTAGSAGGLCVTSNDPLLRTTSESGFFLNKGFTVTDNGVARTQVAYVLVSHGSTGLGAYTASGVRRELPNAGGDERNNTTATGPFMIRAFSDAETKASANPHFDDFLAYRTLPDLVKRVGLAARDWPDPAAGPSMGTGALTAAVVGDAAGLGGPAGAGSLGTSTMNVNGVAITGFDSLGNAVNLSFGTGAGGSGIGVSGWFGDYLNNLTGETIRMVFPTTATKFAVSLFDFGLYSGFAERVELRFFNGATEVGSAWNLKGCRADGGLASYSLDVGTFDTVLVRAIASIDATSTQWLTFFLVSEVAACGSGAASCETSLADASTNTCPYP